MPALQKLTQHCDISCDGGARKAQLRSLDGLLSTEDVCLEYPGIGMPVDLGIGGATPAARTALQISFLHPCPNQVCHVAHVLDPSPFHVASSRFSCLAKLARVGAAGLVAPTPSELESSEAIGSDDVAVGEAASASGAEAEDCPGGPCSGEHALVPPLIVEDSRVFAPITALLLVRFRDLSMAAPCQCSLEPVSAASVRGSFRRSEDASLTETTPWELEAPRKNSVMVSSGESPLPSLWSTPSLRGFDGLCPDLGLLRFVPSTEKKPHHSLCKRR